MAVSDWNTNANLNGTVDGINIAEGCPAGNMNGAIRAVMANVRVMYNNLPDTSGFVTKINGVFLTTPIHTGRGGMLHNSSPTNASGQIFTQASGAGIPAGITNGDWLAEY